jgi:hypothetical protein
VPLSRDLVYVGNADEEIGGLGSRTFVEKHPDLVKQIEYVLTEGADTRVEKGKVRWFGIDVGEKRTWWKNLVVKGTTSGPIAVPVARPSEPSGLSGGMEHGCGSMRYPRITPGFLRFLPDVRQSGQLVDSTARSNANAASFRRSLRADRGA